MRELWRCPNSFHARWPDLLASRRPCRDVGGRRGREDPKNILAMGSAAGEVQPSNRQRQTEENPGGEATGAESNCCLALQELCWQDDEADIPFATEYFGEDEWDTHGQVCGPIKVFFSDEFLEGADFELDVPPKYRLQASSPDP